MTHQTLQLLDDEKLEIVMFCGKGGVGKTTCAAATAIHFAENGLKTLLISTDPAPSLSDILETDVSKEVTQINGVDNLYSVELDYERVVDLWRKKFGQEVYDVVSSFLPVEEDIIDYVSGAPGIDEEFALSYIYDFYKSGDYDVIVWDTAPAGGTLSLLHLQETFYSHMGDAAKLYLRIKDALQTVTGKESKNPLKLIEEWRMLAEDVLRMVRSSNTVAYIVTIPEALGVSQTQRIEKDLTKFGVHVHGVVVNYFLTENAVENSNLYKSRREMQLKYINVLEDSLGNKMPIIKLPLQSYEVKGISALQNVEAELFGSD